MPGPTRLDELMAMLRVPDPRPALVAISRSVIPAQTGPADRIVALGWATPDPERTLGSVAAPFAYAARDRLLGARAARLHFGPIDLLLESPDTEQRLAAFVRRFGEGLAVVYIERPRFMPTPGPSGRPPKPTPTPIDRRGWLVPHEWPWGPFVIVLEEPR